MKNFIQVKSLSTLLALLALGACTPSYDFEGLENQTVTPPKDDVISEDSTLVDPSPSGDDSPTEIEDFEEQSRTRANENLSLRAQALEKFVSATTWHDKYMAATSFMSALEYQSWKPFENAQIEIANREELFVPAIQEYFSLWNRFASEMGEADMKSVSLDSKNPAVQSLIALALAMDMRSTEQNSLSDQYAFDKFSVFGMVRDTLISTSSGQALKSYEQEIRNIESIAKQALEWRVNAKILWCLESLEFSNAIRGSALTGRSLNLSEVSDETLVTVATLLKTANVGIAQLTTIKGSVTLADSFKAKLKKLKLEKEEKRLASSPEASRRDDSLKLIQELKNLQQAIK